MDPASTEVKTGDTGSAVVLKLEVDDDYDINHITKEVQPDVQFYEEVLNGDYKSRIKLEIEDDVKDQKKERNGRIETLHIEDEIVPNIKWEEQIDIGPDDITEGMCSLENEDSLDGSTGVSVKQEEMDDSSDSGSLNERVIGEQSDGENDKDKIKKDPTNCTTCGETISIRRHKQKHSDVGNECRQCQIKIREASQVLCEIMENGTIDKRTYLGPPIVKQSKDKSPVCTTNDKNVKMNLKRYKCNHCNYATLFKSHLNRHITERLSKLKPFACHVCGFKASKKERLDEHALAKHINVDKDLMRLLAETRYSVVKTCTGYQAKSNRDALKIRVGAKHLDCKSVRCHYCTASKQGTKTHAQSK